MLSWVNFPIRAARTWSAHVAVLSAGAALLLAAQPARAADPLSGLTAAQAAELSKSKPPVVLPRRVPEGYRIYAAHVERAYYGVFYQVFYSDGTKTFVVGTEASVTDVSPKNEFRPTGDALRSPFLGTYRLTEGTIKDYNIGCLSHTAFTSKHDAATYEFIACNSLTAAQLTDVINSAQPISAVHASPPVRTPDSLLSSLSDAQQKSLQTMPMPVALFSYVPPGYHIVAVETSIQRGPGGINYHVTYGDGRGTIKIEGTTGGLGSSDLPMQRLSIPVHSLLLGETTLVANKGGDEPDCITHSVEALSIDLQGGYFVKGCHVRPYELKRVIESARLVRPW